MTQQGTIHYERTSPQAAKITHANPPPKARERFIDAGEVGRFVMLSDNPHEIDIDQVRHITATQTWFEGQKVHDAAMR